MKPLLCESSTEAVEMTAMISLATVFILSTFLGDPCMLNERVRIGLPFRFFSPRKTRPRVPTMVELTYESSE